MMKYLGDLYALSIIVIDMANQGMPGNRKRQYIVGALKEWVYPALESFGRPCSANEIILHLDSVNTIKYLCHRPCGITWRSYLVATPEEIEVERRYYAERTSVK